MNDNERIEQIARRLCVIRYPDMDPDVRVYVCSGRQQWETPCGVAFMRDERVPVRPFWELWKGEAQVFLDLARVSTPRLEGYDPSLMPAGAALPAYVFPSWCSPAQGQAPHCPKCPRRNVHYAGPCHRELAADWALKQNSVNY